MQLVNTLKTFLSRSQRIETDALAQYMLMQGEYVFFKPVSLITVYSFAGIPLYKEFVSSGYLVTLCIDAITAFTYTSYPLERKDVQFIQVGTGGEAVANFLQLRGKL